MIINLPHQNVVRIKDAAGMKKATFADAAARVAFRLKPRLLLRKIVPPKLDGASPFVVCAPGNFQFSPEAFAGSL
ncbi:MAG: hypothetical protein ACXWC4_21965 [Telluria sp.]